MNITKTKLLIVALALTATNIATAGNRYVYEATDNSIESSICVAAATGSNLRMNAMIKNISSSKFMNRKYRLVANQLSCNGINVADFAALAGNTNVANKLKSYRGKNVTINDIATTYKGTVTISG